MSSAYRFNLPTAEFEQFCEEVASSAGFTKKATGLAYLKPVEALGQTHYPAGVEFTRRSFKRGEDGMSYSVQARAYFHRPDGTFYRSQELGPWFNLPADRDLAAGRIREQFDAYWRSNGERLFAHSLAYRTRVDRKRAYVQEIIDRIGATNVTIEEWYGDIAICTPFAPSVQIEIRETDLPSTIEELESWRPSAMETEIRVRSAPVEAIERILRALCADG